MSDEVTNEVSTGEGTVNNAETSTGGDTNTNKSGEDKKFTQADVDNIIKRKQSEWKEKYRKEFDKTLEGKLVLTEEEITARVNTELEAYKTEQALVAVKNAIKAEYGLSDEQVSRLQGDTEKALKEDAEKLFGAFKKKDAPRLVAGGTTTTPAETNVVSRLREKLQADLEKKKR